MDADQFWNLIEESRKGASDCEEQAEQLAQVLQVLQPEEIIGFERELHQRLTESYRWDLWAVAYIINGGCSDDGFEYFRGWLVSQGREFFEAVMLSPERAAERVGDEEDDIECEDILYVPMEAYQKSTGREMPGLDLEHPSEPAGEKWEEENLDELYPQLVERFSG